jgi:hypothetical protein
MRALRRLWTRLVNRIAPILPDEPSRLDHLDRHKRPGS